MIIIIGTGAVAAELTFFLKGLHLIKGYLEYDYNIDKYYNRYNYHWPVLADIDNYKIDPDDLFILGVGNIKFRRFIIEKIKSKGGHFTNFVHPSCLVSPSFKMGEGNVISPYCLVDPKVEIGSFNLFTAQTAISHDCVLGDNNFISSSVLCGHVKVGNDNFFGIHSGVIPHVEIGSNNYIGAGVILKKNITDNFTVTNQCRELINPTVD
jgi:sugar O-acyltransferase (sialic acid O-acetyltransferase NeuD family)